MQLSWSSISAGAMTAAVSLGSTMQSIGAGAAAAAHSLPAVAAGGAQAVAASAQTAAAALPGALPSVAHAANGTSALAADMAMLEKPVKAAAVGVQRSSTLMRTAGFLTKALPIVTIGASALSGAWTVQKRGAEGLVHSKQGRGAVLGAIGGTLLLIPTPVTQVAAAGVLGVTAANEFGALDRLDRPARAPAKRAVVRPAPAARASPDG